MPVPRRFGGRGRDRPAQARRFLTRRRGGILVAMKALLIPALAALLLLVASCAPSAPLSRQADSRAAVAAQTGDTFTGRVVAVADGDTITVLRDREQIKIRLYGIDAPEDGDPYSRVAKRRTSDLVLGREVRIEVAGTDRYGRLIARVTTDDGRGLGQQLVRDGLAWWYSKYAPRDAELERLEAEARSARRGLWADQNPVPPWDARAARRELTPAVTGEAPLASMAPVIGNRRSKIYHRRDCPDYGRVSPQNRVEFTGEAEAEAAGYRRAGNCP